MGMTAAANIYAYVDGNPVSLIDPEGLAGTRSRGGSTQAEALMSRIQMSRENARIEREFREREQERINNDAKNAIILPCPSIPSQSPAEQREAEAEAGVASTKNAALWRACQANWDLVCELVFPKKKPKWPKPPAPPIICDRNYFPY